MNSSKNVIRGGACATAIAALLFSILGTGPHRLSAASPSAAANAPSIRPAVVASPQPHFIPTAEQDYTATVRLLAGPKGKAKKLLGSATFAVPAGRNDVGIEISPNYRVEVSIETDESQEPPQHAVQMTLIHLGGKKGLIMAPRCLMADGASCMVSTDDGEGSDVQVEVAVEQVNHLQ